MSDESFSRNPENFCYRHPDRQSFVLCQRCLRTVCPECQTPGPVGVVCPECMAAQRKAMTPAQLKAQRSQPRAISGSDKPVVTYGILALTGFVYLLQMIPGIPVVQYLAFNSLLVWPDGPYPYEPWRALTMMLVHGSFLHMALNMLAVYFIGPSLERLLGHARFLTLYVLSGIGGAVGASLLAPGVTVVGASGAIFGLFGAMLVIGRNLGANMRMVTIIVAINFLYPFVMALITSIGTGSFADALEGIRISWQAHLGGFIAGAIMGSIYARTRKQSQKGLQLGLTIALAVVLLVLLLWVAPALTLPSM